MAQISYPEADRCPFCMGVGLEMNNADRNLFWVECYEKDCLVSGPIGKTYQEAIDKWNARPFNRKGNKRSSHGMA